MDSRFLVVFWILFTAIGFVIALRYMGIAVPSTIISTLALVGGVLGVVCFYKNMQSAHKALSRSSHPDEDVAALIDQEIDIQEYRARKERRNA